MTYQRITDPNIKFTVVIPTRERADTLLHCLRTVVMQDDEDLTIIVSDNFSQDNTKQVVDSFHDPRIKYINTGKRVSMTHNFEFALNHVSDGWVTFLGDDDGLLPDALNTVADVIRKTGCQAIMSERCFYNWPGTLAKGETLAIPLNRGIELRSAREWLGKVMRGDATYKDLPYLYTGGFVNSRIINKGRSPEGLFYFSIVPDVYSAIVIASLLDDYVMLNEPVTIEGASSHSTGASFIGAVNKVSAQKFFSEDNIPFHRKLIHQYVPKYIPLSTYDSYLQSEHVHHDFLKVRMEDQLGMALARISRDDYDDLRKYCVEIADRNGTSMPVLDRKEKEYRRWEFFRSWKERIYRGFKYLYLPGKELGIHDIYEASISARTVLLLATRYRRWRFKKYIKFIPGFSKASGIS